MIRAKHTALLRGNTHLNKSYYDSNKHIKMNPDDIIHLTNVNDEPIIQCRICKNKSGTLINELYHCYDCIYWYSRESYIIKDKDADVILAQTIHRKFIYPVYQKEYYIATEQNSIIGTYGLSTCICIIMRDPDTKKTMLAHVDQTTINPLQTFFDEFETSKKVDVYMIGGNGESINMCSTLVNSFLDAEKYNIKFIHLVDPETNSIGINAISSELYVNVDMSYFQEIPLRRSIQETIQSSILKKIL
jgi:hypothetical protein